MTQTNHRPKTNEEPNGQISSATPEVGDLVVDCEDDDPNEAVVVNLPEPPAHEWDAYHKWDGEAVTVADSNPNYDEDAEVVSVVFVPELQQHRPDYEGDREIPLSYLEAEAYHFPAPRLEVIGEYRPDEVVLTQNLEQLADRLDGKADVSAEQNGEGPVLVVEKLGEEYRIDADGTVEGEGAILGRLEGVVEEVFQ